MSKRKEQADRIDRMCALTPDDRPIDRAESDIWKVSTFGIMPPPMRDTWPLESMEACAPYKAPKPIEGELHSAYIQRMAESFEQWVNKRT